MADTGYVFSHWSGSIVDEGYVTDPHSALTSVLVKSTGTLQANFRLEEIDISSHLLIHLNFNEASGDILYDQSENGFDGIIH